LHAIEIGVADAAGNERRIGRSEPLRVDNRAPAAPNGLTSPSPISSVNRFSANWSLPADSGTALVGARYQLCQSGSCGQAVDAPSLTGVHGLALPAVGDGTLRVWLLDQRGHADPGSAATLELSYRPPPVDPGPSPLPLDPGAQPPLDPGLDHTPRPPLTLAKSVADLRLTSTRRVGRRVTVTGRLAAPATGRVTIGYRVKIHSRTRTTERRATVRKGRFSLTFTLPQTLARPRAGTIVVTYGGDARTRSATRRATLRLSSSPRK
jgi:hypothetical protein